MKIDLKKSLTPSQRFLLKKALCSELDKLEEEEADFIREGKRHFVTKKNAQIQDCLVLIQILTDVGE